MALDFPASPTNGQIFAGGGATWMWDGTKWVNGASATAYAPIASPAFTGDPTGPTPPPGDNDTSLATTAFVMAATGGVGGGATIAAAPPALNPGALWWDSVGGQLYVRYNDGNTVQYVPATNIAGLASAAASLNNVGRNLIHNPLFNVAQRGTGPFQTNGYTLDRWLGASNVSAFTVTRQPFSIGGLPGDESAKYALTTGFAGTAGAIDCVFVYQPIENVLRLSNKTVTVSFWAAATSGTPKLGVSLDQTFGSGGSPQANGVGQSITLSTTYTRYSLTFTIPSAAGNTLGTSGNDSTALMFWYSSGANNNTRAGGIGVQSGTISIWGVQLEIGTVATPLEKPDPRYDLANCQRFYQTGIVQHYFYQIAGQAGGVTAFLPVWMRALPTVTPTFAVANITGPTMTAIGVGALNFYGTATATGTVQLQTTFTASADL